ncbi:ras association domain-containing protein 5 isoform X1 [Takifugu flavidus]|uniref:ras association domain-containing protein 5 isoform X1 n=1 Tax=Takifugu flavidus TaxID=433684 RepID=UPI0025448C0C|nr:ras association domain-containing protein 5 isoform X1 [Takifugu flavidus]
MMASASVVGQHPGPHRLDPEPQILILKLRGSKKRVTLPRRSSWERMVLRRSSEDSAEEETKPRPVSPSAAVKGERMPGEGGAPPVTPAAPRSDADGHQGDSGSVLAADCQSDCDFNHNTRERPWRSAGSVLPIGQKEAHRPREPAHGRRDTWSGDSRQSILCSCSSVLAPGGSSLPPLQRLTQGRTGVVRLTRTDPPRREAWSIFEMDPRVMSERGEGHRFEAKPVKQDWCDVCNRQITAQALKCQNCSYTCHLECERKVQLDCNQRDKELGQTPSPRSHCSSTAPQQKPNEAKEDEDKGTKELSKEEVKARIQQYNSQVSDIGMKLASDGTYTGFIKVNLRLSRPVTVSAVESFSSDGPIILGKAATECLEGTDRERTDKRTSFYLPSDCMKQIHLSSVSTTRDVIQGLLKKFMVLDNPCKFALYKQMHRDGQDLFQKLPLHERPLLLRLKAGPDLQRLSFVLKENETGEVEWHAFSIPELQNFLVILEKEEAERVRAVEQKYSIYRQKLQKALRQHDP